MKLFIYTCFAFYTLTSVAQETALKKIAKEACDSLNKIEKPLTELSGAEGRQVIVSKFRKHISQWIVEENQYIDSTGQTRHDLNQYFEHYMQLTCPDYCVIDRKKDKYLEDQPIARSLYLKSKEFIICLEQQVHEDSLRTFLDPTLFSDSLSELKLARALIHRCKFNSTLSNILVYTNGFTFRARYFNYLDGSPEFQIDIIFTDEQDQLIDRIEIKNRELLIKEYHDRLEFNKKVESGEIDLPPPPPPKRRKKKK